jgi:hypothetical protein
MVFVSASIILSAHDVAQKGEADGAVVAKQQLTGERPVRMPKLFYARP